MANQYQNEGLKDNLFLRMSHSERLLVDEMAKQDERTSCDLLRRLIRAEANTRGLVVRDGMVVTIGKAEQHG